jgi:uncharacterized membrane protein
MKHVLLIIMLLWSYLKVKIFLLACFILSLTAIVKESANTNAQTAVD